MGERPLGYNLTLRYSTWYRHYRDFCQLSIDSLQIEQTVQILIKEKCLKYFPYIDSFTILF